MSTDSIKKTIGVALGVCIVCSVLVSTAAVYLKPKQELNKAQEKRRNILKAGGLLSESGDIATIFSEKIRPVMVELKTGERLAKDKMTGPLAPENYSIKKASRDPQTSSQLTLAQDFGDIKRIPNHALLYLVKGTDGISQIIFPVHGKGLWSTMYGFISLDRDFKTVQGFTFYEHGETPGLGGEVDNPKWQASWKGKIAFDETGQFQLQVLKGKAAADSSHDIDGLSGATITTRGVHNLVKFWLGPDGYGPFLAKVRKEGIDE